LVQVENDQDVGEAIYSIQSLHQLGGDDYLGDDGFPLAMAWVFDAVDHSPNGGKVDALLLGTLLHLSTYTRIS
jgi:hypothetical protein